LPDYLSQAQVGTTTQLAQQAGLRVLGTMSSVLASATSAYAEQAWFGTAVLVDLDEHALCVAAVQDASGQAHLLDGACYPRLGMAAWRFRLLNALADCCVLQSRRDPRDSSAAEQALFDQLDSLLDDCRHGRLVNVAFRTDHWYQNVVLQPDDLVGICGGLVGQVVRELEHLFDQSWPGGPPHTLLLTHAAGALPGLAAALQAFMEARLEAVRARRGELAEEDFGDGLLDDEEPQAGPLAILSPEAAARGAHLAAAHFQRGDLPRRHLETRAPLPLPQPPDAGPPRLQMHGQDYLLRERAFYLGRTPSCDLVFDKAMYPTVSPCHCEIVFDRLTHVLRDLSREGTWVNDQPVTAPVQLKPGDWVRLGPGGPLLRFLGLPEGARPSDDSGWTHDGGQWAVGSE
jgi:hypothetical protein